MTDIHSHDDFQNELAEFALGILEGRARASLLTHVDGCPECSERIQELSATADLLMYIPVGAEPPLGFESGIIERIRQSQPAQRQWIGRRWPSLAAAAAILVISFGLGWTLDHAFRTTPTSSHEATGQMEQRTLVAHGDNVGTVYAYSGKPSWVFVTVDAPGAPSTVRCTVITSSGAQRYVGSYSLSGGKGSWGATLPVSFSAVRNVELTSASGAVVAQFNSTTWNYPPTVTN